jgi:hypothetical protein
MESGEHSMVKVLCRGGPQFWIKEPYTEFETRMLAAESAQDVRDRTAKGWIKPQTYGEYEKNALANDPVPPPTDEERARWAVEYPDEWYLWHNEVWPLTPAEEDERWAPYANIKSITFYGSAPHRPNRPPAGAAPDKAQATEAPQATPPSRHREP